MRLTTVGTGTAAPTADRVQAAHLIEAGSVRLLLDCGSGAAFRLANLGIRWQGITHVAISHFHADHTSDLATLLYAWRYGDLSPRAAPLELIGPPGLLALISRFAGAFGEGLLTLGYPVSVRELAPGGTLELGDGARIAARKVPHTDESVAYSVEHGGRRIVYTGDTAYDQSLGEWAAQCDVLLCECSLPETMALPTHLTPQQCGALAHVASPALLVLTHFYPPVEATDIRAAVAGQFPGPVVLAHDGWQLDLEET